MSLGQGAAIPNGSSLIAIYGRKGTPVVVGVGSGTGASFNNWNCNLATLVNSTSPAPSVSAVRSRSTIY